MSVPQNKYVGKRYVPLQCGDWDNTLNTTYESLSVVLWQGASYTSKQDVPKGIDISNVNYWVKSADYNAQVALYREDVENYHQYVLDQITLINNTVATFETNVNLEIAENIAHMNTLFINAKYAPAPLVSAKGDGLTDDSTALNAIATYLKTNGGGTIILPSGIYLIGATLLIPNNVFYKGEGKTSFINAGQSNYINDFNTIIKLKDNSNVNMVTPTTPDTLSNCGFEDIILDGNKDSQTVTNLYGIYLPDTANDVRGHFMLRNVLVTKIAGVGIYNGLHQDEIIFENVISTFCTSHGFVIKGNDCSLNRALAGSNGGSGFILTGSGYDKLFNIDAWDNLVGIEIYDVNVINFFWLQSNLNKQYGLYVHGNVTGVYIFGGQFHDNSAIQNNGFSDVFITNTGSSPEVKFIGCRFTGSTGTNKPKYAIEDTSTLIHNSLESCEFINNYATNIFNYNVDNYYVFSNVTQNQQYWRGNKEEKVTKIGAGEYGLNVVDTFLEATTANGIVDVNLTSNIPIGKKIIVSKITSDANVVNINAPSGFTINGATQIQLTSQWQTKTVIFLGTDGFIAY